MGSAPDAPPFGTGSPTLPPGTPDSAASERPAENHGPEAQIRPGRNLGHFTILEKIGQGGMGTVFRAFDTSLERTVALKVLLSSPLDDPKHAQRFLREARSLARLSHPNLVHVYNVGIEGDYHYFAMELLEGETLSEAIRRRQRIPAEELIPYLGQILSALYQVHQQGITHRDVKSGNIMVFGRRAVLMDFGLVKDEGQSGLTSVGAVLGTPDYMSPEAATGVTAGPPTDIYSLGIVMYEALTGALPFSGRSAMSIIRQHVDTPPPPIEAALPVIAHQLALIVHRCLAKAPAERYAHCPALAAALVQVQASPELTALAEEKPGPVVRQTATARSGLAVITGGTHVVQASSHAGQPPLTPVGAALGETLVDANAAARGKPGAGGAPDGALSSAPTVPSLVPGFTAAPTVLGPQQMAEPDAAQAQETGVLPRQQTAAPRAVPWRAWAWMAAGFFGVLILAFCLGRLKGKGATAPPPVPGQPALLHKHDGTTEEVRWIEFKAGGAEPSKWQHVIERKQPNGTWARVTVSHGELIQNEDTLEFLPVPGGAQKNK